MVGASYLDKNSNEDRRYTITGGELHVHATGNTSWADSRYTIDFVADEDQAHRYLLGNLDLLNQDDVIQTAAVRPKRPSESVASSGVLVEDDAHDDEGSDDSDDSDSTEEQFVGPTSSESDRLVFAGIVAGAVVLVVGRLAYVFGKPVWDNRVNPAIEHRRAERAQRNAAAASERERTKTRDRIPNDEG